MLIRLLKGLIYNSVAELRIMKIYRVLGVILVALCFFACGTTNIFVRDKITNESCSIEVNVILPFLTLNFEVEKENHLNIIPYSLFALVASEDSICYVLAIITCSLSTMTYQR